MKEREPDFEDEKIRCRLYPAASGRAGESGAGPTMLSIEQEKEEIFESRVYGLRLTPVSIFLALRLANVERIVSRPGAMPGDLIDAAADVFGDSKFRLLAKRRKEDSRITDLLLSRSGDRRRLLLRQNWVTEEGYRDLVARFERDFLERGVENLRRIHWLGDYQ